MIPIGNINFLCDECPLGKDNLQSRYERLRKYGDWQPEYCGCDKIGEEHFWIGGYCEDAHEYPKPAKKVGKRKTGRAYRRAMNRHKDNRLRKILTYGYHPEAGYVDWDWVDGVFQPVGNHIKYPKNSNRQVYWKTHSNRVVRRYRGYLPKGNGYRKLFEYMYTIY